MYTLKEIGAHIGISAVAVSKLIKNESGIFSEE